MLEPTTTIATLDAPPRRRIAHAEHPGRPGVALCGAKLTGRLRGAGAERCVVCLDLTRRPLIGR